MSCEKLLIERGQIFTVPSQLYTIDDDGNVSLNEVVKLSSDLDGIFQQKQCTITDEEWALLMEDEDGEKEKGSSASYNSGCGDEIMDNNSRSKNKRKCVGVGEDKSKPKRPTVENDTEDEVEDEITKEMLVTVLYEGEVYPGRVIEVLNTNLYRVTCMRKSGSSGSTWRWPSKKDEDVGNYPKSDIIQKNIILKILPGTSRNIEFHVPALEYRWGKPLTKM